MSKYIWQLKNANITPIVKWKVVAQVFSEGKINFGELYFTKKVFIINALNDNQLLKKNSKLINTFHPQDKLLLKDFKKNNRRHDSMY